jgi:16S rRNA (guanine527-N7)-methyltransferase
VSRAEFASRLAVRAARARIIISASQLDALADYFDLLRTWNRKINLTGMRLEPLSDEAIDRLFVEPLAAARILAKDGSISRPDMSRWLDLGSGGGSPAIPMKVALPALPLTMIESKSRKAAFLRKIVREGIVDAQVINARLEETRDLHPAASLVTVRAVRLETRILRAVTELMSHSGHLAIFQARPEPPRLPGFQIRLTERLADQPAWLHVYARMFHVEHIDDDGS